MTMVTAGLDSFFDMVDLHQGEDCDGQQRP